MIRMTVVRVIGQSRYTFTFEGETLFDVVAASQHLGFFDVERCGKCKSTLLSLHAYETKDNQYRYVKIVCGACRARATFGKTKKEGAFFLRKDDDGKIIWEAPPAEHNGDEEGARP
jgi:hypothetical protein